MQNIPAGIPANALCWSTISRVCCSLRILAISEKCFHHFHIYPTWYCLWLPTFCFYNRLWKKWKIACCKNCHHWWNFLFCPEHSFNKRNTCSLIRKLCVQFCCLLFNRDFSSFSSTICVEVLHMCITILCFCKI